MLTKEALDLQLKDNPFSILWMIIYEDIYHDIADGRLMPGDKISEIKIASALSISRSPVKKALDELMKDGILIRDQKHILVGNLTAKDYLALYEARKIIEENAAYLSARNCAGEYKECLRECLHQLRKAIDKHDVHAYRQHEREFHRIIIRSTDNKYIINMYELLSKDLSRYQFALNQQLQSEKVSEEYLNQEYFKHKRIYNAIINGLALEARDAISYDMQTMYRTICHLGVGNP